MRIGKQKGFTLIELLVVIAIIALLLSIIVPALGKAKEYSKRVVCANNVKQLTLGTRLYSEQNNDELPLNIKGSWYWDISYETTDFLMNEGGMVQDAFYCPSDKYKIMSDYKDKFWRFSEVVANSGDLPTTQEPTSKSDRQKQFRLTSYFYLTQMGKDLQGVTGARLFEPTTGVKLVSKMSQIKNTGTYTLFSDAIIRGRDERGGQTYSEITGGWTDMYLDVPDTSCHVGRDGLPVGSNVGYADGHVSWKRFEDMKERNTQLPVHFW